MTAEQAIQTLNRVCKWRAHFAGWQLGTRAKTDAASQAVRDINERLILLRAEHSALARMMIEKGLTIKEEFTIMCGEEAEFLDKAFEERWPGVRATDDGLVYDMQKIKEAGWMGNWYP